MARQGEKESYGNYSSDAASLSQYEDIKKLAEAGLDKEYLSYDELLFKLRRWWCQYYRRPYKDPLLDQYTLEELLFEYFDLTADKNKPEEQKVTEQVEQEDRDWAAEEEERELAELEAIAEAEKTAASGDDTIPEEETGLTDEKWADSVLSNPSADQVDAEDGDISATFEV